jgi:hypothetical protein
MHISPRPARRALTGALAVGLALATTGCLFGGGGGGGGGGDSTPTTGSLMVSASFSAPTGVQCLGTSTFTYTPITLVGTGGVASTVVHTVPAVGTASNNRCPLSDAALDLRFGTWRVNWSATGSSCTVDIRTTKWVRFNDSLVCTTSLSG